MSRFEYKTIAFHGKMEGFVSRELETSEVLRLEDWLNRLGSEGWELVGIMPINDGKWPATGSQGGGFCLKRQVA